MAFLLCKNIEPENPDVKVPKTLSGIFDMAFSEGVPSGMDKFWIFLRFFGGTGNHEIRLVFQSPSGKDLFFKNEHGKEESFPATKFVLASLESIHDVSICIRNLILYEFGTYKVRVYLDGNCISEHPLQAIKK